MDLVKKLELHYYFQDESHSMDARVRNTCEREIIELVYEAASILGLKTTIESEAYREGGLREAWSFIGKHNASLSLLIAVIALILSQVPKVDQKDQELQRELTTLSIEEKKLRIEKLKKDLGKDKISIKSVHSAAKIVNNSYKVLTRKSNFYKLLTNYEKIDKVSYSEFESDSALLPKNNTVFRNDFKKFILFSNNLKPIIINEAKVEIVAPVLNERKAKWKGVHENTPISFWMNDSNFKEDVVERNISFQNGSYIICVLLVHKKLDEVGEVVTTGYSVDTVIENSNGYVLEETPQGRQYRFTRKQVESQRDLFERKKV